MIRLWKSPAAGVWYQDSRMALENDLQCYRREISAVRKQGVCAAVVPHAAYRFSGKTAAGVYLRIDPRRYGRVVILAPSHYRELRNRISTPDIGAVETPLGEVPVDTAWVRRFLRLPFAVQEPLAHEREHADQIQIPMVQAYLSMKLPVVTLVCGRLDADRLLETADALRPLLDDRTLLVVTSDFTHFGTDFGDLPSLPGTGEKPREDGLNAFELFASGDLQRFLQHLKVAGYNKMCIRDPLPLLMALLPERARISRVGSAASRGALYGGALVEGRWSHPVTVMRDTAQLERPLDGEEGSRLLALASSTLKRAFRIRSFRPIWGLEPAGLTPRLRSPRGGFVTLYREGRRLGCMGELVAHRPVWQVVVEQTLNAAFHDSRVEPLREGELAGIEVEIESLSPLKRVDDWRKFEIGRHGIVLRRGSQSAFLLPRAAREGGWSVDQTLERLSVKAGLPPSAWQDEGSTFLLFETQVFRGKAF